MNDQDDDRQNEIDSSVNEMLENMDIENGNQTIVDASTFKMPEDGEIVSINIINQNDDVTPFTVNLDENIGNIIGRATGGVRSDRFEFVLKDGTVLDSTKTLRDAGVGNNGNIRMVEQDSGIGSMADSSSETSEKTMIADIEEEELNDNLDDEMNDSGIIFIETDENVTELPVSKSDLIDDIITRYTGTRDNDEIELLDESRALPRNISLRDAGIRFGSKLRANEHQINVFIRCPEGGNVTVQTRRSSTVGQLKCAYYEQRNVPVHQQRLQFQSKPLEDSRTLKSYGIKNCSSIDSTYRLRGGAN